MYRIRRALQREIPVVLDMDAELFTVPYRINDYPGTAWWVALHEGEIAAYAAAVIWSGPYGCTVNLTRAAVLADHRGHGLQRRLIDVRCGYGRRNGATEAWTYTHWANHASINNLLRRGFRSWTPETWGGVEISQDDATHWLYWWRDL